MSEEQLKQLTREEATTAGVLAEWEAAFLPEKGQRLEEIHPFDKMTPSQAALMGAETYLSWSAYHSGIRSGREEREFINSMVDILNRQEKQIAHIVHGYIPSLIPRR